MNSAQGLSLDERVEALCETTDGRVDVADIAGIVSGLVHTFQGDFTLGNLQMQDEIRAIRSTLETARRELSEFRPLTLSKRDIPEASAELHAVVNATEDAAGKMMDAAEAIEGLVSEADAALVARMTDIASRIYEASSFQDIAGQRITKVTLLLQHLESRLGSLAELIGDEALEEPDGVIYDSNGEILNDKALLHGPQLPEEARSQADIDALLASFD